MTTDQIRAEFEKSFPLPVGVHWNDDHYMGTHDVIGSFSNASIWSHTYRGWRKACELLTVQMTRRTEGPLMYVESVGFILQGCVEETGNTPLDEFILSELTKRFEEVNPTYSGPMASGTGVKKCL